LKSESLAPSGVMRKAVITAAGLGTRLSPATKELPKEMLPIFHREGDRIVVKPLLQLIFEQLHDVGIREFCFVIGRGKRAIEDHFTPDPIFLRELRERGKGREAESLERFYAMLSDSSITWVNQPEPRGFGDAVLGASFKPGTDDARESPAIWLVGELGRRGAIVRVCDPAARAQGIEVIRDQVIRDPGRCLEGADAAVLATEWDQFREPEDFLRMRGRVVVDTRRVYDPGKFGAAGMRLIQLGRGSYGYGRTQPSPRCHGLPGAAGGYPR